MATTAAAIALATALAAANLMKRRPSIVKRGNNFKYHHQQEIEWRPDMVIKWRVINENNRHRQS